MCWCSCRSGGRALRGALHRLDPDIEIVGVERELAGGECSYYACVPTKTLLRPTEVLAAARLSPGAAGPSRASLTRSGSTGVARPAGGPQALACGPLTGIVL
ncbi:MAG: hypothetical protein A2Y55_08460 [Actinobacteria bacterium RBG_16_68_12]|nr:MAG: hypothetical protein A2Y55_08460 [Actinobacteria bacterium RBG_16_68_12]